MPENKSSTQMMELKSNFELLESQDEKSVSIKGFVSVEKLDRQLEFAPALEFNVDTFINDGTVLVNHDYWRDSNGNKVSVGKVQSLVPSYIAEDLGENWAIKSILTHEFVSEYPKAKVPELSIGDRGLFAFVTITQPDVVERVRNGDYGTFSWRGLTKKSLMFKDGMQYYALKSIDIWEVSIVNIPVGNQSSYVISKNIGDLDSPYCVTHVLLSKNNFETQDSMVQFLESHSLKSCDLTDSDDYVCASQGCEDYDLKKCVRVKLGCADLLMSPTKAKPDVQPKVSRKQGKSMKLYTFSEDTLKAMFQNGFNTSTKSVEIGDQTVEVVEVSADAPEATEEPDLGSVIDSKLAEHFEKVDLTSLTEKLSESATQLADLQTKYDGLKASFDALSASNAQSAAEEGAESETLETVKSAISQLIERDQENRSQLEAVVKSLVNLGKAVPSQSERQEASKSVPTPSAEEDVSSFFNTVLGKRG